MQTTYEIGLRHSSISRSRTVRVTGTLTQAKRVATREFGNDFDWYNIVIIDSRGDVVATRRVGERRWS